MNVSLLRDILDQTLLGTISFPQVVATFLKEGLESYHVDLVRWEYRYYKPNGESHVESVPQKLSAAAKEFSAEGVRAAVKASQAGEIKYREFLERALKAGCVNYIVYLNGKKVVYFGRNGESHTELFPQPK